MFRSEWLAEAQLQPAQSSLPQHVSMATNKDDVVEDGDEVLFEERGQLFCTEKLPSPTKKFV